MNMDKAEKLFLSCGAAVIAAFIIACVLAYKSEQATMKAGYQAWIKQTGNSSNLSYKEWSSLVNATRNSSDTTIYTPIIINH